MSVEQKGELKQLLLYLREKENQTFYLPSFEAPEELLYGLLRGC